MRAKYRPPQGWAGSFVVFSLKATADVLCAGQSETIQRVDNGLQMPLRQMQVLRRGFQIAMTEQNLNGAQVGARLQQVSRPTVAQRVRRNALVDTSPTRSLATCDPDGLVGNRLIESAAKRACGKQVELRLASAPVLPQGFE